MSTFSTLLTHSLQYRLEDNSVTSTIIATVLMHYPAIFGSHSAEREREWEAQMHW